VIAAEMLEELKLICDGASQMVEGGCFFVYLPGLRVPSASQIFVLDALLCLQSRDGYPTRLFLSQLVPGRGNNWTQHRILDRTWYTWSWNNVAASSRPTQILAEHLRALR
jgi:hypothetical protein